MMQLSYGDGIIHELEQGDVARLRACEAETMKGEVVGLAVQEALANPVDYPDLASATVPGDCVAVVLQYETPQVTYVLDGILTALRHAGVEGSSITVLLAPEFSGHEQLQQALRDVAGSEVKFLVHDASVEDQLALLGITAAGRPLRLNRILCDADVIIPVGVAQLGSQCCESTGAMFPRFSDIETCGRFQAPATHETSKAQQKLAAEVTECDWMLGVGLALQIVPGPSGSVAAVYCGTPAGIAGPASAAYRDLWVGAAPEKADLVVATIVGNEAQQTWQNLSRALVAASEVLFPGGAIAICSDIATRPGPSGRRLRDSADLSATEQKLLKDEFPDSLAALQLCRCLQRGTVYLMSRLDADVVERLGFAPITSTEEIDRLVRRSRRCIVLEEAQHLVPVVEN